MNTNDDTTHPSVFDRLEKQYPIVFKYIDQYSDYNIPEGWYGILDKLCLNISMLLEEELSINPDSDEEPLFIVLQIKEKFGGLRFYYMMNTKNDELYKTIQSLIDIAEDTSYTICEITGKPGILCKRGYLYKTVCEEVRKKDGYEPVGRSKESD